MKPSPWKLMLVTLGIIGAACGGGTNRGAVVPPSPSTAASSNPSPVTTAPRCTPAGTTLRISANVTPPGGQFGGQSYDKDCLAAPANIAFKIGFDNKDSEKHNVSIYTNIGASTALFKGTIISGPKKIRYNVKPLPAGMYYFHCDVHPNQMNGTFVVSE